MDHHRAVGLVVGAGIFQFEALGQIIIYLYSAQLPGPADGIAHHKVEFGAIKSGLAEFGDGF